MTHHHNHDNDHSHDHSHDSDHSHSNDHGHSHELTFEQKLEKLFGHWIDHNESHKDTFFTWAKRAREADLEEVAGHIEKAGQLSNDVTRHIKDALNKLKG
jgi:hypothetical protein